MCGSHSSCDFQQKLSQTRIQKINREYHSIRPREKDECQWNDDTTVFTILKIFNKKEKIVENFVVKSRFSLFHSCWNLKVKLSGIHPSSKIVENFNQVNHLLISKSTLTFVHRHWKRNRQATNREIYIEAEGTLCCYHCHCRTILDPSRRVSHLHLSPNYSPQHIHQCAETGVEVGEL